ncbi:MAG: phosphoribosylamine--glycine ligase, partial [Clostridiales bacterium]|nr:phosphoribosylamine--glycine ligase [Clostridiales bacterium]
MNVLLIGSGGREHAIAWKLKKDNPDIKLFCAPGNGGTALIGENIDIAANDLDKLLAFAQENEIELTIVGSEEPLTLGICDLFEKNKLRIFGPNKAAARLEGSKGFAKRFMRKYDIPTAKYQEYGNFFVSGSNILSSAEYPIVIKADGLAAGKGVKVCQNKEEALEFAREMFAKHDSVVLEERLTGWEVSLLVFTDGRNYRVMPPSMDHKRAFDNDQGDNTGGMGAISPVPKFTDSLRAECERIIDKTLSGLRAEGIIYRGVLYFGLMITDDGPKVIEYNCRFGDPETQAILPRLKNNLLDIMFACIGGTVS